MNHDERKRPDPGATVKRDLGTYHLRVELIVDGKPCGYIQLWQTCADFIGAGLGGISPLTAHRREPTWASEEELFSTMQFSYFDGNDSCDCNLHGNLAIATTGKEAEHDTPCGEDKTIIVRLTAIRPDGSEHVLYQKSKQPPG